jgi:putative CocE/NonD family hydrolase
VLRTVLRAGLLACAMLAAGGGLASEPAFAWTPPAAGVPEADAVAQLSRQVLAAQQDGHVQVSATGAAHLRLAARRDRAAIEAVRAVMDGYVAQGDLDRLRRWVPYLLLAQARADRKRAFGDAYAAAFESYFARLDDLEALRTQFWFGGDLARARTDLRDAATLLRAAPRVPLDDALGLARRQAFADATEAASQAGGLIAADQARRYAVDEQVLIRTPDGATLSAVVARRRGAAARLPTAMQFTIYADPPANRSIALQAAARGYAGVVVDARGKRLSRDAIRPYETEASDTVAAIDWIASQPWSDGQVAMYGGSYSGFAAWAATKRMPKALKTIVPYVAAMPGLGLPMENNVFVSANYAWPFYVASGPLLDHATYGDRARWQALPNAWYASGRPYRDIDRIDGTPNPWLQKWLRHPAYDAYWQAMVPHGREFARIGIPVLSITGYYDDGQVSALQYMKEHVRHRPDAVHYLVIGPYDHFGAQAALKPRTVNGVPVEPSAQFDTEQLAFQWLDHVMRGAPRPAMLRDRINYQLMGADQWGHAPSLQAAATPVSFHLSAASCGPHRCLTRTRASTPPLVQAVDFADRTTQGHAYYPDPALSDALQVRSGFAFASEPFPRPASVVGTFSGALRVRIDRRDFDFSVSLYELMPDGRALQLSYAIGRASHARDMGRRELLQPGRWTTIPFERTRMTARRLQAGSRLVVVVDMVKNPLHQLNLGTGRDVSDESIADAAQPLRIEWHPDSVVRIPLREEPAR